LKQIADVVGWPTPMAQTPGAGNCDYSRTVESAMGLRPSKNEPMAGWPSPKAQQDNRTAEQYATSGKAGAITDLQVLARTVVPHGPTPTSSNAGTGDRGALDAAFSRWLMGYPKIWDHASPNFDQWQKVQEVIASEG
jgi:hypothetical protein